MLVLVVVTMMFNPSMASPHALAGVLYIARISIQCRLASRLQPKAQGSISPSDAPYRCIRPEARTGIVRTCRLLLIVGNPL